MASKYPGVIEMTMLERLASSNRRPSITSCFDSPLVNGRVLANAAASIALTPRTRRMSES